MDKLSDWIKDYITTDETEEIKLVLCTLSTMLLIQAERLEIIEYKFSKLKDDFNNLKKGV